MVLVGKPKSPGRNKQKGDMKRFGNLFEKMCSIENIREAHHNARKGKVHYVEVKMVDARPDKYLARIHDMLVGKTFRTSRYQAMTRTESGKVRHILKLPYFPDRIVHHCIVQVLEPIWNRAIIRDTFACIPGRGIHDGVRRVKRALRDRNGSRYCLKMDVKKFYPSIDHDVLKAILRRKIKDNDALDLLGGIIDSSSPGVPIGNYLSQHFGNLYLTGYDHWMKEVQLCRYYYRYCDDVVVLGASKERLHKLRESTERYWRERLCLTLKDNWQVFPVAVRGIDFLGYRFFPGYTLLRKKTALQFKRKMAGIRANWERMRPVSVLSSIMSYEGWLRPANCLNLKKAHIGPAVQEIVTELARAMNVQNPLRRCVL